MIVSPGSRVAIVDADATARLRLRADAGLAPGSSTLDLQNRIAYCGADFRVYPFMRVADAVRFFEAMHDRFDRERLDADFDASGLRPSFEVRRMKRAYQRALVLALAAASLPDLIVVESAEEFDDPRVAALLDATVARAPSAVVTFGGDARPADGSPYTSVVSADAFRAGVTS